MNTDTHEQEDVFACVGRWRGRYQQRQAQDSDVLPLIDLSVGNPDVGPDLRWRRHLAEQVLEEDLQGYGDCRADINLRLRQAFLDYYRRRFCKTPLPGLQAEQHVIDLAGSKEGIFHCLFTCLQRGDTLLLGNPGYAVYKSCAQLLGAHVAYFEYDQAGQPRLESIDPQQARKARLIVCCTPNNPTAQALTPASLDRLIRFAEQYDLYVVLDRAYAEISYVEEHFAEQTVFDRPGALNRVVELHSLSKSAGAAGWRMGFAIGAPGLIARLALLKFNVSFGAFLPLQRVATQMLDDMGSVVPGIRSRYAQRVQFFVERARQLGWSMSAPQGTFFIWAPIPARFPQVCDVHFAEQLLDQTGIAVMPGSGFGTAGRGYVRIAMVQDVPVLEQALARLDQWFETYLIRTSA